MEGIDRAALIIGGCVLALWSLVLLRFGRPGRGDLFGGLGLFVALALIVGGCW